MNSNNRAQQLGPTGPALGHSPVAVKPSSVDRSRGYEEGEPSADLTRRNKFAKLNDEMKWSFVSVADWMSACLPGTDFDPVFQPFDVTLNKNEAAMYPGLCNGINGILQQIGCTEFLTYCTADLPDNTVAQSDTLDVMDTSPMKVDLSILPKQYAKPRATQRKAKSSGNQTPSSDKQSSSSSSIPPPGAPPGPSNPSHACTDQQGSMTTVPNEDAGAPNAQDGVSHDSPSEQGLPRAECSWHWAEVLVEVKLQSKYFPFPEHDPLSNGAEHKQSRGQLVSYALQMFRMQHRKHVFLVSICGKDARLVWFDRSGAIVSEGFDYTTEAGVALIGQFLYRLFRPSATREERGADPTATLASKEEVELFKSVHLDSKRFPAGTKSLIRERLKAAADGEWPIYTLSITSRWSQPQPDHVKDPLPVREDSPFATRRCLVGKPMFTSRSLEGRGTKCFVGWDIDGGRPVMIKDSWRADLEDLTSELNIYRTLWIGKTSINATYIPTPLGGGDVYRMAEDGSDTRQYQRTLLITTVPALLHTPWPERIIPRIHTRLVLHEICRVLEDFTDAQELVGVIFHALLAHREAWTTHKILHRDISVHNILIYYPNAGAQAAIGLLSDWDLARTENQLQKGSFLPWRSGTWQYMSALLQFMREKHHEVSDDLESFMHVLNWCALRYLPSDVSDDPVALATHMHSHFDRHVNQTLEDGTVRSAGVLGRLKQICKGEPFASVKPPDHPFASLLKDLASLCQQHYATYDVDQIIADFKRLEDRDQSAEPQSAESNHSSAFYLSTLIASEIPLGWLEHGSQTTTVTGPREPITPTRASSSRSSPGPAVSETLHSSNVIILNSPPPAPRTRVIKDRSESPLLDHTRFSVVIWNTLKQGARWGLLPKSAHVLKPSNVTTGAGGGSSGSSSGLKRRSERGDDDHYASTKRKRSTQPSPRGSSDGGGDDPFSNVDLESESSAIAAPGTCDRPAEPEGQVQNAATQLFKRGNQADPTRTARRSSKKSPKAASPSASPTA